MAPLIPESFRSLLAGRRWKHPGDAVISRVIPFILDPIDFLNTEDSILRESMGRLADEGSTSLQFKEKRGSSESREIILPWRDVEKSIIVAVNRNLGDDVGVALDFRTSVEDPRVIGMAWSEDYTSCDWREIAPRLSLFLEMIEKNEN
jgi:hypothetical protein